jgi:hypothetical protein
MKKQRFDQTMKIRTDARMLEWVNQLAAECGRTPSAFMRDLIFYLRLTKAGGILCAALVDQDVHYRPIPSYIEDQPIVKPIFPWAHMFDDTANTVEVNIEVEDTDTDDEEDKEQ